MQVNTLYNDSSDLKFDLSIFGQIVLSSQTDIKTLKQMVYDEMSEVRPIKTFEVQRKMLSEQVSADYVIKYNSELQLTEDEIEVDFTDLSELEDYDVADELADFEEDIKEVKSRCIINNDRSPLSLKQVDKINKAYEMFMSSDLEVFTGNVDELEQQILEMKEQHEHFCGDTENIDSSVQESQDDSVMEDVEIDFSNMSNESYNTEEVDLTGFDESDGEYDIEDEYLEDTVKETNVTVSKEPIQVNIRGKTSVTIDLQLNTEDDEYTDETEGYEEDEEYTEDEEEYEEDEEDYGEDYEDDTEDDYEDEIEAQEPLDIIITGKTSLEYTLDTQEDDEDDEDYEEDYEDDTEDDYKDEEDEGEYEEDDYTDDEEDEYAETEQSSEDEEQLFYGEEESQQVEDINDFLEPEPEPVVKKQQETAVVQEEKPKEDEPKDLIQFLRKHPKCEISFALKYFSKKEIEKYIRTGSIIKKNGKLFF